MQNLLYIYSILYVYICHSISCGVSERFLHEISSNTNMETASTNILLCSVVFKFIAMLVGLLGNATVLIQIIFFSKEKSATSYLVANLAVADFLACVTFYPTWIIEFLQTIMNKETDQHLFCMFSRSSIWSFLFASVATLLAITLDRYVYIVKPLKYHMIVTRGRVFKVISTIWFLVCLIFVAQTFLWKISPAFRSACTLPTDIIGIMVELSFSYIPLIFIFILHFRMLKVAREQQKRILAESKRGKVNAERRDGSHRIFHAFKMARTFLIVVAVLSFCVFTPTIIAFTLRLVCDKSSVRLWFVVFHYEFYGLNSIVNAFIYGMRHSKYRKVYGRILLKIFLCKNPTY
ncbi:alpha-1A adrenergic receptor-like [Dendronephthya gigantea]|uniref:alpha-1A adrenergic receptor-like n=1 Tax=Dendronephthya gigantea TaxID=151771 RepID=UPI00106B0F38|nr:alpha-1A adrenergic receptor-like [Dendronephthya gigantea]